MGLVQIFEESSCPVLVARRLFDEVREEFFESGKHYQVHLELLRQKARRYGTTAEVEALDRQLAEHACRVELPRSANKVFSWEGYNRFGRGIFWIWAVTLVEMCKRESCWEEILLSQPVRDPYQIPGFRPQSRVNRLATRDPLRGATP